MLHPSEQRDVIDLDTAFRPQLIEIPVRQRKTQIPPNREQDHLGREPVAKSLASTSSRRLRNLIPPALGQRADLPM